MYNRKRVSKDNLSESQKKGEDYFIQNIDSAIEELVYDKDHLIKAYNYYNGVRDEDQFQHLEENFGIGTPTSIEFIPLIRRHIDILVGEHLQNKLKPQITCKDSETLSRMNSEKMEAIYMEELELIQSQLMSNISYALMSDEEKSQNGTPKDIASEERINKLRMDIERDFISEFEISAHYVLRHLIQDHRVDIYEKLRLLFLDLLIAGQCYYKITILRKGMTPVIEVLNPFDVFRERNHDTPKVNKSSRIVNRRWLNKQQIITRYGVNLTDSDIEELKSELGNQVNTGTAYYSRATGSHMVGSRVGITITPNSNYENEYEFQDLYPVYEVEWLANNKIKTADGHDYTTERYEGVRIGASIYVDYKKSEFQMSGINDPFGSSLSVGGVSYDERGTAPFSLVLSTAHLQDKYDILHFYRDNLIASSGVKGDFLDVSQLPAFLGTSPSERIAKYTAYKKQGVALIDTAQEGRAENLNTIYGGFDDTVSGDSIQAIQLAIHQTEEICSAVTGVFRERLGGIEQRDAVSNVEVGIKQSAIITKQYYKMMDTVTKDLLTSALDACQVSYQDGLVGSIILGNKLQKVFTLDPDKFCTTDYDVHISDSGDIIRDMETIKSVTMELIKAGTVDIDVMLEALTSESLTELKENVSKSYKEKQAEHSQLNQAMEQLSNLEQQLQEAKQAMQELTQENESLSKQADQLKQAEIQNRYRIDADRNRITEEYNEGKLEVDNKKVDIELAQLMDNNPHNNKVKY